MLCCNVLIQKAEVSSPVAAVTDISPAHGANAGILWPRKTTIIWKARKSIMPIAKEHFF